ncbi:MAG: antifreeze protein [Deltaproteobacteria bacterium]|nr:MAG: antifreeze protein [Deltaproteobacteria bacterium]
MGIWDTLTTHAKAQFLDVIEWTDGTAGAIVYRFPVFDKAITDQSKLVVREGQAAVFVSEGALSDVFGPGTYTLDTRNTPITSFFESIKYGLNYPYKGDILFVDTTQFTENRWGTANPFMLRDAEFGPVRIRAFGVYSFRITDPAEFIRQIVGADGLFTKDEITGQLKRKLVSALADTVGQARIPVLDLAANYMDLGDALRDRMNPAVQEAYGITITDFTIENISLPAEVEKALDQRTKMGVLGNLDAYAKLQAAEAIGTAAANPGLGGAGIGMGVGFGMGNMMGNQMAGMAQQSGHFNPHTGMQGGGAAVPPPLPGAATFHYSSHGAQEQLSADAIAAKVAANRDGQHLIWQAGWSGWKPWNEVPEIATKVPPPAAAEPVFHYHGDAGSGEKPLGEIVALIKANPGGKHHLWAQGFDGWKPASEVPEVAAALAAGPPPPPGGDGPPPPPM